MPNTGRKKYTKLIEIRTDTGLPTGVTKNNTEGDPDYIEPVYDTIACPPSQLAWRGVEGTSYCLKDNINQNTGNRVYITLEQYDSLTNISTGVTKPNLVGDPDYIPPFSDFTSCPIVREKGWRIKPDSTFCVQGQDTGLFSFTLNWDESFIDAKITIFDSNEVEILSLSKTEVSTSGIYSLTKTATTVATPYRVNFRATACAFCSILCVFENDNFQRTGLYQLAGDRVTSTMPLTVTFTNTSEE